MISSSMFNRRSKILIKQNQRCKIVAKFVFKCQLGLDKNIFTNTQYDFGYYHKYVSV